MLGRMQVQTEEFREALSGIQSVEPFNYDPSILNDRRMLSAGLLIRNALYTRSDDRGFGDAPLGGLEFEPNPARLVGNTQSHHGVIPGDLHTNVSTTPIVVKCYETHLRAAAVREHVANEFMRQAGFDSFRPIGIVAHEGRAYLMTIEEPSLKTFNNMHWSPRALAISGYGEDQIALIGKAGHELGAMHAMGLTHGDARTKNVALSERGTVGFIDFESLIHDPDGMGSYSMTRREVDDILSFYGSLRSEHGYSNGVDAEARYEQFGKHFMHVYSESLHNNSTLQTEDQISQTLEILDEELKVYMVVEKDNRQKKLRTSRVLLKNN